MHLKLFLHKKKNMYFVRGTVTYSNVKNKSQNAFWLLQKPTISKSVLFQNCRRLTFLQKVKETNNNKINQGFCFKMLP